jgi:hypothetical protein
MSVNIVRIPPAADGGKQGIDDYLATGGLLDDLEILPFEGGWLPPRDWPTLADQALQGVAGEVVEAISPNTESDPVAILALFLAAYGNMIGRGAYFIVEGDTHYCKIWPVITGESGKGRKGTAQGRVNRLLQIVDAHWFYNCQAQGLSSGEGVVNSVRDRRTKEGKDGEVIVVDEGVIDKRVLITEPEFAGPLTVMQREGNTLSVVLRMAWDDTTIQTMTKNQPEKATGSHITVASHTNQEELLKHLTSSKLGAGIGNRSVFLLVRRSKELPHGGEEDVFSEDLVERLQAAVRFGREERHIRISKEVEGEFGQSAWALWAAIYSDLSSPAPGLFGAITGRAEAQVRRFSTTYAALECSPEVKVRHLLAGLALWEYSKQSAYLIFKGKSGDEVADEILTSLQGTGTDGLSRTEIYNLFNRNVRAGRIRAALLQLKRDGWIRVQEQETGRPGPNEERWFASVPD